MLPVQPCTEKRVTRHAGYKPLPLLSRLQKRLLIQRVAVTPSDPIPFPLSGPIPLPAAMPTSLSPRPVAAVTALLAVAAYALTVSPSAPAHDPFPVFVKSLTGRTITVYVPSSATVLDLKSGILLKDPTCLPEFQLLVFAGQILYDLQILSALRIPVLPESTVHLMLRLRGGPSAPAVQASRRAQTPKAARSTSKAALKKAKQRTLAITSTTSRALHLQPLPVLAPGPVLSASCSTRRFSLPQLHQPAFAPTPVRVDGPYLPSWLRSLGPLTIPDRPALAPTSRPDGYDSNAARARARAAAPVSNFVSAEQLRLLDEQGVTGPPSRSVRDQLMMQIREALNDKPLVCAVCNCFSLQSRCESLSFPSLPKAMFTELHAPSQCTGNTAAPLTERLVAQYSVGSFFGTHAATFENVLLAPDGVQLHETACSGLTPCPCVPKLVFCATCLRTLRDDKDMPRFSIANGNYIGWATGAAGDLNYGSRVLLRPVQHFGRLELPLGLLFSILF